MVLLLRVDQHVAHAASLAAILLAAPPGEDDADAGPLVKQPVTHLSATVAPHDPTGGGSI